MRRNGYVTHPFIHATRIGLVLLKALVANCIEREEEPVERTPLAWLPVPGFAIVGLLNLVVGVRELDRFRRWNVLLDGLSFSNLGLSLCSRLHARSHCRLGLGRPGWTSSLALGRW